VLACLAVAVALVPISARGADELDYGLQQHTLHKIVIRGNHTLSGAELKSILKIREPSWLHPLQQARYRPELLDAELTLIQRYYRQRGFHQVAVKLDSIAPAPRQQGDVVNISVVEGPRTYLDHLVFTGGAPLKDDLLRQGLAHVETRPVPADLNDFGQDIYTLRTHFWDAGYLQVLIVPELQTAPTGDPARRSATLIYHITPGRPYRVGQIGIEGNRITREQLIRRELRLRAGDTFRWSEVDAAQRRLLETALFRDVSFVPTHVDSSTGVADMTVRVVERRPAFYEVGAGVGNIERVRVLGAWGHNNLWGTGQRLQARARLYLDYERLLLTPSGKSTPQFNWRYDLLHTYPHFLGRQLRLDSNLYYQRQSRGASGLNLRTLGFTTGSTFRGPQWLQQTLALQEEQTEPTLYPGAPDSLHLAFEANNIRRTETRSLNYNLLADRRDDLFRPRRGWLATVENSLAGGALGGDNSFVKSQLSWHGYTATALGGVLALRASFGAVRTYGASLARGSEGVPYQARFFAGGASTVRGYVEGSLGPQMTSARLDSLQSYGYYIDSPAAGGNYLMLTNAEWRFPLPSLGKLKFGGVLFVDGGNVWQRWRDIQLRGFRWRSYPRDPGDPGATRLWDYRYSVGTGLRLDTPFGPFRFDVGFPMKRARLSADVAEDTVIYHFSLGYPF
jgi:outer membrane protein insertion porin family